MPDTSEFVDAYDTRTGAKQTVPKAWLDADVFPHLSATPKHARAEKVVAPPAKTASKGDWVKYATKDAPADKRLSPESADALSVDALHDYYVEG